MIHDRFIVDIFRLKQHFSIDADHHHYGYYLHVNMISKLVADNFEFEQSPMNSLNPLSSTFNIIIISYCYRYDEAYLPLPYTLAEKTSNNAQRMEKEWSEKLD
jgi:hypothetical protein